VAKTATAATRPLRGRAGAAARGITAATGPAGIAPNSSKTPLQIGYDRIYEPYARFGGS
jgi:hypothetical protein